MEFAWILEVRSIDGVLRHDKGPRNKLVLSFSHLNMEVVLNTSNFSIDVLPIAKHISPTRRTHFQSLVMSNDHSNFR